MRQILHVRDDVLLHVRDDVLLATYSNTPCCSTAKTSHAAMIHAGNAVSSAVRQSRCIPAETTLFVLRSGDSTYGPYARGRPRPESRLHAPQCRQQYGSSRRARGNGNS